MKALPIAIALLLIVTPFLMAEDTGTADYTTPNEYLTEYLNSDDMCIKHTHEYTDTDTNLDRDDPYGVGADITLYENADEESMFEAVEAQYKYDFANDENSVYLVAQFNLWELFKKE